MPDFGFGLGMVPELAQEVAQSLGISMEEQRCAFPVPGNVHFALWECLSGNVNHDRRPENHPDFKES